jgi:hypothetical protein
MKDIRITLDLKFRICSAYPIGRLSMKIARVKSQIVKLPADEPLAGGPGFYRPFFEFVTLRMETDAGIEGIGVTFLAGPSPRRSNTRWTNSANY